MSNRIILKRCNLCADPEVKTPRNGDPYVAIRVADNSNRFNQQSQQWETYNTDYYTLRLYDQAKGDEALQNLRKGQAIYVEGTLKVGAYVKQRTNQAATSLMIDKPLILAYLPKSEGQQNLADINGINSDFSSYDADNFGQNF
jgi:single stranded DNA-binding protein